MSQLQKQRSANEVTLDNSMGASQQSRRLRDGHDTMSPSRYSSNNLDGSASISKIGSSSVFDRLHDEYRSKQQFKEQIEELKILNEMKDCTF